MLRIMGIADDCFEGEIILFSGICDVVELLPFLRLGLEVVVFGEDILTTLASVLEKLILVISSEEFATEFRNKSDKFKWTLMLFVLLGKLNTAFGIVEALLPEVISTMLFKWFLNRLWMICRRLAAKRESSWSSLVNFVWLRCGSGRLPVDRSETREIFALERVVNLRTVDLRFTQTLSMRVQIFILTHQNS